ncbi:hypothetical protein NLU13_7834 [Sarocladium strictum]|uniref:Uncharacterized protein n=1 Tax=Sarocladium strictum TaxID=5046 RepID=A0AA39GDI9_SARSR|nr:hypothetical protein NLU13_7834 [Sarocladium strictum]
MPAAKRSADSIAEPRRRSGRLSSTPKKSNYFEDPDTESGDDELPPRKRGRPSKTKSLQAKSSEEKYDVSDEDDELVKDEEESRPRKRGRPPKNAKLAKKESEDQYEDDEEEEDDDEDEERDEAAPMRTKIIPLEQMRDAGGVDYEDYKIHKNTLLFLRDLKANNRRPWLKSHDGEYRRALQDWNSFVETMTEKITEIDETVPELPIKDVVFRIHRDIRFSKDPTPYKPHFSAAWSRTGRKGPYACYYIHCEPGSSFLGGGLWCPEASHVRKLRRSIDRHPDDWRAMLNDAQFRRLFLEQGKKMKGPDVIDAFCEKNSSNALKKKPMGYEATHPDIKLLRLRNFTVGQKLDDSIFCKDDVHQQLEPMITALRGFVTFLNRIVMPDPGEEDESDDEEEDNE